MRPNYPEQTVISFLQLKAEAKGLRPSDLFSEIAFWGCRSVKQADRTNQESASNCREIVLISECRAIVSGCFCELGWLR